MRVYYTQNLRKYDSGNVQIGQNDLEILPGSTNIDQSGGCSSFCTQHILPHPIYITRTYQHMHYLGKYRNFIPLAQRKNIFDRKNPTLSFIYKQKYKAQKQGD